MHRINNVVVAVFVGLWLATPAVADPQTATTPIIKPAPKKLLKGLTITFDASGNPIFSKKNTQLKAIECNPATLHGNNDHASSLPACGPAGYASAKNGATNKVQAKNTGSMAAEQANGTQCYTIYWVEGGVVYSYTYCWDTSTAQ